MPGIKIKQVLIKQCVIESAFALKDNMSDINIKWLLNYFQVKQLTDVQCGT